MAFIFGSIAAQVVPQIFSAVLHRAINRPMSSPTEVTPTVVQKVVEEMKKEPDITVVRVRSGIQSISGWSLALGAGMQVLNYISVNGGSGGAVSSVEYLTSAVGMPAGSGSAIVGAITLLCMGIAFVRKIFFDNTITPAAATRAVAAGTAL